MTRTACPIRLLVVCLLLPLGAFAQQFASYPSNPSSGAWESAQNQTGYGGSLPAIFGFYTGSIPGGNSEYEATITIPANAYIYGAEIYLQSNSTGITNDTNCETGRETCETDGEPCAELDYTGEEGHYH